MSSEVSLSTLLAPAIFTTGLVNVAQKLYQRGEGGLGIGNCFSALNFKLAFLDHFEKITKNIGLHIENSGVL